jgi:hypothetical protein
MPIGVTQEFGLVRTEHFVTQEREIASEPKVGVCFCAWPFWFGM